MRFSVRLVLAIALLLATSTEGQSTSPYDYSLEGNVYTNFFFRFRYPFSASWVPQTAGAPEQRESANQSCLGNSDATAASVPANKLYNLLTLSRSFPGHSGDPGRATIWMIAEPLPSDSGITTGKECIDRLLARMSHAGLNPDGKVHEVKLSNIAFFQQDLAGSLAGARVYESVFFTQTKGYAVGFILTAQDEQARGIMLLALEKVKFF